MKTKTLMGLALLAVLGGAFFIAKSKAQSAQTAPPGHRQLTLTVGGLERRCLVHLPPGYEKAKPLPLVIMLHGMGGTAINSLRETGWSAKADAEKFIVAYPEGTRPDETKPPSLRSNAQAWNDGSGRFHAAERKIDDVAFLRALLDKLSADNAIDARRIFVAGFSNGASMCFRVGAELADRIAAIAPDAGACWTEVLQPARAISLCYFAGTADTLNPMEGGFPKLALGGADQGGKAKPAVIANIAKWAKALGCPEAPALDETKNGVRSRRYGPGRDGAEVVFITIEGLSHHWAGGVSQAPEFLVGKNTDKLKATDVAWNFFEKHPAPEPAAGEASSRGRDGGRQTRLP